MYKPSIWFSAEGETGSHYEEVDVLGAALIDAVVEDVSEYGNILTLRLTDGRRWEWHASGYEYEMEVNELPKHSETGQDRKGSV